MSKIGRYEVEEIMSGTGEECLWVTVGFASDLEDLDVLHIVCATECNCQHSDVGQNRIYLERFDRAYSCYGGAECIEIQKSKIRFELNAHGVEELDFRSTVEFDVPPNLADRKEAWEVLERTWKLECGRELRLRHI